MNRLAPVLLALSALAAGLAAYLAFGTAPAERAGLGQLRLLDTPRTLPAFTMTDAHGDPFTGREFAGNWSVLFFGFTHCPDICPTTLYDLARFRKALADLPASQIPRVYLVSVDPDRDTPERLDSYLTGFDAGFRGLTGADDQLATLAASLGAAYGIEPDPSGGYEVLHTAALFFLDSQGRFAAVSTAPHDYEQLARDYRAVLRDAAG